jgi:RimJ/RimL family protein N-acetyltransferase
MNDLKSKTVRLRLIEVEDAEFVLGLRLDGRYNQFLSAVKPDLNAQKQWIVAYKQEESAGKQFYFIIERLDGVPCGTVRVYDIRDDSFCWGSWILNESKTRYAAIESAFLVYEFGFNDLGFTKSHFDVMKKNERVISFHKKMGAIETGEDEFNIYFEITHPSVEAAKKNLINRMA